MVNALMKTPALGDRGWFTRPLAKARLVHWASLAAANALLSEKQTDTGKGLLPGVINAI